MSAKTWMKWLSVIALVLILFEIIFPLSFTYGENFKLTSLLVGILLLAITQVISIFNKK
jgi:hypothetical protein